MALSRHAYGIDICHCEERFLRRSNLYLCPLTVFLCTAARAIATEEGYGTDKTP
jgi:hypothetical protein